MRAHMPAPLSCVVEMLVEHPFVCLLWNTCIEETIKNIAQKNRKGMRARTCNFKKK
jgi:hypothetical protein